MRNAVKYNKTVNYRLNVTETFEDNSRSQRRFHTTSPYIHVLHHRHMT